jgi:adenylate cyclase
MEGESPTQASPPAGAVFLSYASQDAEAGQRICEALRSARVEVWFDQSELRGGDAWDRKIRQQIRDCALFLPIISRNTQARAEGYFRLEWRLADQRTHLMGRNRAFLVPVCVDATREKDADVPDSFSASQWTRLPGGKASREFIEHIQGLLSMSETPAADQPGKDRVTGVAAAPGKLLRGYSRSRLAALVMAAVAVIAIAYLATDKLRLTKPSPAAGEGRAALAVPTADNAPTTVSARSIAVLPFADMSEKKDQEYFADGMAEEIIDLLARVPDLRVPARTSSFYFKGKQAKIPDIARELSVANVLEGSIRRSGDRLRVTAQLVRADNGFHLWSQTYDRDVHDVFRVQDDIANAVVQALQITLMGGPLTRQQGGTQNLEAYQLYLRAAVGNLSNSRPELEAARGYLEQAIKLDPDFALAWTSLAFNTFELVWVRAIPRTEGFERSRQLAQHALELNPELPSGHHVLGYVHRTWDWDWASAQDEVQRALAIDPRYPPALILAGQLAATLGRWTEAERHMRAALERDPLNNFVIFNLATIVYRAGRYADAESWYQRLMQVAPKFVWVHEYLAKTLLADGRPALALATLQLEPGEGDRLDILPMVLHALGRQSEASAALGSLVGKFGDSDAYFVAMNYAYRNDRALALQWLDRAYKEKDMKLGIEIVGERLFANLADDPGYKSLLRKMNLPEE